MKRLTTDTPKDNVETALNLFYIKDHETWVRGGGPAPDYPDISLDDYMRMLIRTHIRDAKIPEDWKEFSFMMAEWLFDDTDSMESTLAVLYSAAWAFAELRNRLKLYEDIGLEPEEIKAKLEDAERRVVQMRKQWQEAEQFICMRCKEFDWEEINGLICGTKNCGNLSGVPFCDKYVSREAPDLEKYRKAEEEGRLVVLPCKVGQTVYKHSYYHDCVDNLYETCELFAYDDSACCRCYKDKLVLHIRETGFELSMLEEVGETVFLTREEAEAALAAVKNASGKPVKDLFDEDGGEILGGGADG